MGLSKRPNARQTNHKKNASRDPAQDASADATPRDAQNDASRDPAQDAPTYAQNDASRTPPYANPEEEQTAASHQKAHGLKLLQPTQDRDLVFVQSQLRLAPEERNVRAAQVRAKRRRGLPRAREPERL